MNLKFEFASWNLSFAHRFYFLNTFYSLIDSNRRVEGPQNSQKQVSKTAKNSQKNSQSSRFLAVSSRCKQPLHMAIRICLFLNIILCLVLPIRTLLLSYVVGNRRTESLQNSQNNENSITQIWRENDHYSSKFENLNLEFEFASGNLSLSHTVSTL